MFFTPSRPWAKIAHAKPRVPQTSQRTVSTLRTLIGKTDA